MERNLYSINIMEERKIVVVGAGLTGLTCAAYLRRKGQDVVVLEATDRIGGLMQTEEVDGFVMEQGPSTGTIKHPEVAELFDMLGDDCTVEVALSSAKCPFDMEGWTLPCPYLLDFGLQSQLLYSR